MIAHLRGTVLEKNPQYAVVEVGGVGYRVFITLAGYDALPAPGREAGLHTVTIAREDALLLYGFVSREEKEMFLKLVSVTRIGPRLACAILSGMRPEALTAAVLGADKTTLSKIPGVGGKTAERIILELKDKLVPLESVSAQASEGAAVKHDALEALVNLGYARKEAEKAVAKTVAENPSAPLGEILRKVLKSLSL